jgi:hypothetical protein
MRSVGSTATCERPSKDDDTTELTRNDLDSYDWAARASAALAQAKKLPPGSVRSEEEAAIISKPRQDRSRTRCDGKGGTESPRRLSGGDRHYRSLHRGFPGIPDQKSCRNAIGAKRAGHVGFPPRQRDLTKVSLEQSLHDFFCCLTALCSRRKFYEAV